MIMSFIIPCYNGVEHTQKCIPSIVPPPGHEINFVFIDNNSNDGTYEYLKSIPNSYIIRNNENLFVNPAWNQGFSYILHKNICDYVCLCNNDIVGSKGWLEPIFHLFATRKNEFYIPSGNFQPNQSFNNDDELNNLLIRLRSHPLHLVKIEEAFPGFCLFINKKDIKCFYPVPDTLKVLRGDDWIVDCLNHNGISAMQVNKCVAYHFGSATQRGMDLSNIHSNDHNAFDNLYNNEYRKRGMKRIYERQSPPIKLL